MNKSNGVLMQYFHWYIPADGSLWKKVSSEAKKLSEMGITSLWLPPVFKGLAGANSVGYDIYDLYDLGEFDQKGSVRTKYGTKDEYLEAVKSAHDYGINIYADIVFNHKAGADYKERVWAQKVDWNNREAELGQPRIIEAWTKFTFPGRIDYDERGNVSEYKYSKFLWDYLHFDGVDWDEKSGENAIFKFEAHGDTWEKMLDSEKGNYDYLMFADIDFGIDEVRQELKDWAKWFIEFTNIDGFRLDAIKHITLEYFIEWLDFVRAETGKELFTVGEYWNPNRLDLLEKYVVESGFRMSLFDAPLQNKFHRASKHGSGFDLRKMFDDTLVAKYPIHSVTLVDNHDTQPLQALEAPVEDWFKPLAYAFILLRQQGYPCVFYPDIYGAEYTDKGKDGNDYIIILNPVKDLPKLLEARKNYAYGKQIDYFDFPTCVGWTRLGNEENPNAMAVVISTGDEGYKDMYVGENFAGKQFVDFLNNRIEKVLINGEGIGRFSVNSRNVSVWIGII
ncbi:MAG: alpha-amylase [Bacteroidales bacterium]|nr:alpha-amylase [Bacteroidales bacterium]